MLPYGFQCSQNGTFQRFNGRSPACLSVDRRGRLELGARGRFDGGFYGGHNGSVNLFPIKRKYRSMLYRFMESGAIQKKNRSFSHGQNQDQDQDSGRKMNPAAAALWATPPARDMPQAGTPYSGWLCLIFIRHKLQDGAVNAIAFTRWWRTIIEYMT